MKLIYVGPPELDDPTVHAAMQRRFLIARTLTSLKAPHRQASSKVEWKDDEMRRYYNFVKHLVKRIGKLTEVAQVVPDLYEVPEREILANTWSGVRAFHDVHLEELKAALSAEWGDDREKTLVHVDLGNSLATMFAGYFAVRAGLPLAVTFHLPVPCECEDESPGVPPDGQRCYVCGHPFHKGEVCGLAPFGIGGFSIYAHSHSNLRRKLIETIIRHSQYVFIPNEGIGGALRQLLPQIKLTMFIDPFFDTQAEEPVPQAVS